MRADSCSGPTTDSICGHGLGRMGHSSNFARWPHLGPIPPMDGGGHLVPLSYVYGYRGGVGRRGVAQDTIGDNGLDIRARVRRYQLILSRCSPKKSALVRSSRVFSCCCPDMMALFVGTVSVICCRVPVGDTVGAAAVSGARPVLSLVVMVLAFGARLRRRYAAWLLGLRLPP